MGYSAAVITISDKGSKGERVDTSGTAISNMLEEAGYDVVYYNIIPDEIEMIKNELIHCSDHLQCHLIITTGGTGFSPRDVTPEATLSVIERETRGIPEAMRAESLKITSRGCLSRSVAGIRGKTLIINLPGSKKAASENLDAVLGAVEHGLEMLNSSGSADCANHPPKKECPSMDLWLKEAKRDSDAKKVGMFLFHNGVVRETAKELVRNNIDNTKPVKGMLFSYDKEKLSSFVQKTKELNGIYYVRVWLNEGELEVGDDIMYVLIGGDIRPHVVDALDFLVGKIKSECVIEKELF